MTKLGATLNRLFHKKMGLEPAGGKRADQAQREKWLTPFTVDKHALRFLYMNSLFQKIRNLPGCIVECGVAAGRTLLMLSFILKYYQQHRLVVGYDTFEGLPAASPEDGEYARQREGSICVSQEETRNYLRRSNIGESFVNGIVLVKGDVRDTLTSYNSGPIALLHLDMDLYGGYKAALQTLYDKVVSGGIVALDDFEDSKWQGASKAIREFFGDRVSQFEHDAVIGKYYYTKP